MKWLLLGIITIGIWASPATPDYSQGGSWAALPDRADAADLVPDNAGLADGQAGAAADVFFIHPTTYYRSYSGNADVADDRLNRFTDKQSIAQQASVYNGHARVYAPRYRQASLHNFFRKDDSKSRRAFEIAYSDVRRAFEYYLEHCNEGRPVIIAGHSQGSMHGKRLLTEFFDGTELQSRLVAAYLVGHKVAADEFRLIPVCESAGATGCVLSFSTYGWEAKPRHEDYSNAICVNPMNWQKDGGLVARDGHAGAVPRTFDRIDPNLVSCKCVNNILWITKPKERGYAMMGGKNYHLMDYSLFYMDIRRNVEERISAFLNK
jgi:hypothetical protein